MNLRSPILGRFAQDVAAALGTVKATLESPFDPRGMWFLDLEFEERRVVVQQQVEEGYLGTSRLTGDDGYGEKPDRVFTKYGAALAHTLHLLAVAP
jgi:hypothetical protein